MLQLLALKGKCAVFNSTYVTNLHIITRDYYTTYNCMCDAFKIAQNQGKWRISLITHGLYDHQETPELDKTSKCKCHIQTISSQYVSALTLHFHDF